MLGTRAAFAQEDINVCQLLHIGMHCSDAFRQVWWVSLLHRVGVLRHILPILAHMCSCSGCPACQWILEKWRTRSCNETLGRTQAAKLMMRCTPCWTLLRQDEDTQVPIPTPGQSRHRRVCAEVGERDQRLLFSIDAGADRFNSFGRKVCFFHGPWARLCFRILPRTFRLRPLFQAAFHFNSDALLPRRAWQRHAIGGSGDAPAPPPPGSRGRATRDGGPLKGRGVRHGRLSTLATLPLLWRPGGPQRRGPVDGWSPPLFFITCRYPF